MSGKGVPNLRETIAVPPVLILVAILSLVDFGLDRLPSARTPPISLLAQAVSTQNSEELDMKCPSGTEDDYTCQVGQQSSDPKKTCEKFEIVENSEVIGECVGPGKAQAIGYKDAAGRWVGISANGSNTDTNEQSSQSVEDLYGPDYPAPEPQLTPDTPPACPSSGGCDSSGMPTPGNTFQPIQGDMYQQWYIDRFTQLPMTTNGEQPTFGTPSSGQIGNTEYSPVTAPQEPNDTLFITPEDVARLNPDVTTDPNAGVTGQFTPYGRYIPPAASEAPSGEQGCTSNCIGESSNTFQNPADSGILHVPSTNTFEPSDTFQNKWPDLQTRLSWTGNTPSTNIDDRRGETLTPESFVLSQLTSGILNIPTWVNNKWNAFVGTYFPSELTQQAGP